ncbi:MAG: hypothetical protein AAF471_07035 [Myxococcota bacterium]
MPLGLSTNSFSLASSVGINLSRLILKITLVNVDEGKTLKVMLNPQTITKGPMQATYTQHAVALQSHPLLQYQHSGGVQWNMRLYLHANTSGGQSFLNLLPLSRNISKDAAFLESLVYPLAASGTVNRRPPVVRFVIPGWVNQKVVVTSVSTVYKKFDPLMRLHIATVDVAMVELADKPLTCAYIRKHGASGRPGLLGPLLDATGPVGDAVENVTKWI